MNFYNNRKKMKNPDQAPIKIKDYFKDMKINKINKNSQVGNLKKLKRLSFNQTK